MILNEITDTDLYRRFGNDKINLLTAFEKVYNNESILNGQRKIPTSMVFLAKGNEVSSDEFIDEVFTDEYVRQHHEKPVNPLSIRNILKSYCRTKSKNDDRKTIAQRQEDLKSLQDKIYAEKGNGLKSSSEPKRHFNY